MKTKALVPLLVFALSGVLAFTLSMLVAEAPVAQAAPGPQLIAPTGQAAPGLQLVVPRDAQGRPTLKVMVDEGGTLSPTERDAFLNRILPKLGSGLVVSKLAKRLGVTYLMDKDFEASEKKGDGYRAGLDQPVDSDPVGSQNEPSIAASPIDESIVVVLAHNDFNFSGSVNACSIYLSFNGGVSYFYDSDVPLLNPTDFCSDPVVRFSPDGNTVYYNYLSVRSDASGADAVVATAPGSLPYQVGPATIVLDDLGVHFVDKNWIDVHTFDSGGGAGYVYTSATVFLSNGDCGILMNRSSNYGATWDYTPGALIVISIGCNIVVQGSRPVGGPGSQVLICYYNSETDGFRSGRFDITCQSSPDRLSSVSNLITAANNVPYELPLRLGPNGIYHRWWGAMFPSIAIDHRGAAHVVFTMDPTVSQIDVESGNVQYVRSTGFATIPPYGTWTGRVTIGSGARAQGYATVAAQIENSNLARSKIYIAYYDHYRSQSFEPNVVYDVRYRKSINGGATFAAPVTVTDVVSLSDLGGFIGDYIDSSTTLRRYHLVWTDRGDKVFFDSEDDIFADRF